MTIWIASTDLMRLNYLHRMRSLANCLVVCVFRKTQENLRNSVSVKLITDTCILGNPIIDCLTVVQLVQEPVTN